MLPQKKVKKRPKSKSPTRPSTAGEGDAGAAAPTSPKPKSPKPKSPRSKSARSKSPRAKSPRSKSPKPKSPRSKSPKVKSARSKSPRPKSPGGKRGRKSRSRSRSGRRRSPEPPEPEADPEVWRPRSSTNIPDYEMLHVTESLQPLRSNFFTVIEYLAQDEKLKNYSSEFVRLFERVARAHDLKAELAKTVEEQAVRMEDDERTVSRLKEQVQQQSDTVAALLCQVDDLKAQVDASHLRELDSAGQIENLREEVERYQEQMRHVVEPTEENEAAVDYDRLKKAVMQEKQGMLEQVQQLKRRLAEMYEEQETMHRKNSAANLQVTNLSHDLRQARQDAHRDMRLKEKLEEEMEVLAKERDEAVAREAEQSNAAKAAVRAAEALQQAAREQRAQLDRVTKDNDSLQARLHDQQRVNDRLRADLDKVRENNKEKSVQMANQEEVINKLRAEVNKVRGTVETMYSRLGSEQQKTKEVLDQKEELAMSVKAIGRELERTQREVDQEKREAADLIKSKEALLRKVARGEKTYKTAADDLLVAERHRHSLEEEIAQYANEAVKQRRLISTLEQEREQLHADKAELNKQVEILVERLHQSQGDVLHYQRQLADADKKFQQQVNQTEDTALQRNKLEKLYEEARENGSALRSQSQLLSVTVEQLKETLAAHEREVRRLTLLLSRAESDITLLKKELNSVQARTRDQDELLRGHEKVEAALKRNIADLERTRDELQRSLRGASNERDIIGTQLVRRNDEIRLLLAKIDVLQSMLASGEEGYSQRVEDIRLLKLEVRKLRQEKVLLQRDLVAGAELRRELYHLTKDLSFERQRRAALEEELKSPMNLHRWRRLEATDPASHELLHKVNILQRRLLQQHSVLLDKERRLQDAEKLYLALREAMLKMPGPDVLLRLRRAQQALDHRANKIKALFAELNMSEATVHDYRIDLNRTREELADYKSMFFTAKKKLDLLGHPMTVVLPQDEEDFPKDPKEDELSLPPIHGYTVMDVVMYWKDSKDGGKQDEEGPVRGVYKAELPQFTIIGYETNDRKERLATGIYQRLSLSFRLQRNIGYFVFQTYLPSILIVMLSWVSFWINHEATSARVALGITTVLTMTTISTGVRSSLPRISYVKAIDIYLVMCFVFVFAALLEYAAVNYTYWGARAKKKSNKDKQDERRAAQAASVSSKDCFSLTTPTRDPLEAVEPPLSPLPYIRNQGTQLPGGLPLAGDHAAGFPPSFRISRASYAVPGSGLRFRGNRHPGRGPSHPHRPRVLHALKKGASAIKQSLPRIRDVNIIDKYSRVVFPMSFILFNAGYWIFYVVVAG